MASDWTQRFDAGRPLAVVTGASTGIGHATARALAAQGFQLVLVSKDAQRAGASLADLAPFARYPVETQLADLGLMSEVKRLAAGLQSLPRLDALINCAGAFYGKRRETTEGHELTWALNHLAPFALSLLLFDLLAAHRGRIVNLCTRFYDRGRIDFDDLSARKRYSPLGAYAAAKLANLVFTRELARRSPQSGVKVYAVQPGDVNTNAAQNSGWAVRAAYRVVAPFLFLSPEQGADTVVWAATCAEVPTGALLFKREAREGSAASGDLQLARRLWDVSEQQSGVSKVW